MIDRESAVIYLRAITLSGELTSKAPVAFETGIFLQSLPSSDEWQAFCLEDPAAACQLMFRDGYLWQVRMALVVDGDREKLRAKHLERERHAAHEALLLRELGATEWRCPDGNRIELCRDERNLGSSIVVTYAAGGPVKKHGNTSSS